MSKTLVGRAAYFSIYASDASGARATRGGEAFVVAIRGPSPATRSIRDNGDGTYTVTYCVACSGAYTVAVTLHGEPIRGSPWRVKVSQLRADASRCTLDADALRTCVAGQSTPLFVELRDALGGAAPADEELVTELVPLAPRGGRGPRAWRDDEAQDDPEVPLGFRCDWETSEFSVPQAREWHASRRGKGRCRCCCFAWRKACGGSRDGWRCLQGRRRIRG